MHCEDLKKNLLEYGQKSNIHFIEMNAHTVTGIKPTVFDRSSHDFVSLWTDDALRALTISITLLKLFSSRQHTPTLIQNSSMLALDVGVGENTTMYWIMSDTCEGKERKGYFNRTVRINFCAQLSSENNRIRGVTKSG